MRPPAVHSSHMRASHRGSHASKTLKLVHFTSKPDTWPGVAFKLPYRDDGDVPEEIYQCTQSTMAAAIRSRHRKVERMLPRDCRRECTQQERSRASNNESEAHVNHWYHASMITTRADCAYVEALTRYDQVKNKTV